MPERLPVSVYMSGVANVPVVHIACIAQLPCTGPQVAVNQGVSDIAG